MCYKCSDPAMAGLHQGHLHNLRMFAPAQSGIITSLFEALTENLHPHLPMLPALIALIEAFDDGDFGVLEKQRLVRLPLSIIGINKIRYRTELVEQLHETILSARMSELTMDGVRRVLRQRGLCVLFLCSCGIVLGRCADVRAYYGSTDHRRMELLRSAIDAAGNPVVSIAALNQIPVCTMDLHHNGAEERLFTRIETLTNSASIAGHQNYSWIEAELQYFTEISRQLAAVD